MSNTTVNLDDIQSIKTYIKEILPELQVKFKNNLNNWLWCIPPKDELDEFLFFVQTYSQHKTLTKETLKYGRFDILTETINSMVNLLDKHLSNQLVLIVKDLNLDIIEEDFQCGKIHLVANVRIYDGQY